MQSGGARQCSASVSGQESLTLWPTVVWMVELRQRRASSSSSSSSMLGAEASTVLGLGRCCTIMLYHCISNIMAEWIRQYFRLHSVEK